MEDIIPYIVAKKKVMEIFFPFSLIFLFFLILKLISTSTNSVVFSLSFWFFIVIFLPFLAFFINKSKTSLQDQIIYKSSFRLLKGFLIFYEILIFITILLMRYATIEERSESEYWLLSLIWLLPVQVGLFFTFWRVFIANTEPDHKAISEKLAIFYGDTSEETISFKKKKWLNLISKNSIEVLLEELNIFSKEYDAGRFFDTQLILIKSRRERIYQDFDKGILSYEEFTVYLNRLSGALINLIISISCA